MRELYREKWSAKVSTHELFQQVVSDYGKVLAKLTPEEIKKGLNACLEQFDYPPTPADFYKAARIKHTASHTLFKALPKPPVNRSLAREQIRRMKVVL